jgi:hypothetical protein
MSPDRPRSNERIASVVKNLLRHLSRRISGFKSRRISQRATKKCFILDMKCLMNRNEEENGGEQDANNRKCCIFCCVCDWNIGDIDLNSKQVTTTESVAYFAVSVIGTSVT